MSIGTSLIRSTLQNLVESVYFVCYYYFQVIRILEKKEYDGKTGSGTC